MIQQAGLAIRLLDDSIVQEHTLLAKVPRLRLSAMSRTTMSRILSATLLLSLAGVVASAQSAVGATQSNPATHFRDTSMLVPPPGAKVAIFEWEDLECPMCAHAFPFVHMAMSHYKIPLVRRDFQIPGHVWSHEASVFARYLDDKVSPDLATDYRRQVFASQYKISSKDDLNKFTQEFFAAHGKQLPFVLDPTGQLAKEVDADKDLGLKLGVVHTPTIVVVTAKGWIEVVDVSDLYQAIDTAEATVASAPAPAHHTIAKK
jgi:protein-disulfide isomerase